MAGATTGRRQKQHDQRQTPQSDLQSTLTETLIALAGIPSVSGHEDQVRAYVRARVERLGAEPSEDAAGNLIARIPAVPSERDSEPPLLLNAHLDRVPPGLAHTPIVANGIMRSDGATNLGADDSAGIAIILHTVEELCARGLPHPPLLLLFTTGEEVGLTGARAFDAKPWGAHEGIVFDNAGEAGVVVTRAATYIAFDVTLTGSGGHPGKQLEGTASAIEMFHRATYPSGSLDGDTTRVSIGRIEAGTARNAIPRELRAQGEVRTLLEGPARDRLLASIERDFTDAATALGGSAHVTFDSHCDSYTVSPDEPLLRAYAHTSESLGRPFRTMTTFIGSDASALRRHTRVFTVSTGAMDEHTAQEWIALAPLADLTETTITLLSTYRAD
ncbi:MAG: M20/M25/M40 family metallo-hydrolase [Ktedonobacterales bacterium]